MFAENYATDSYQNLLFSIIKFKTLTGRYPTFITIVSHGFKERRFREHHCKALRWQLSKVRFEGIDPPQESMPRLQLDIAEAANRQHWESDLYGCDGFLDAKRRKRGWLHDASVEAMRLMGGYKIDQEISNLLCYDGQF